MADYCARHYPPQAETRVETRDTTIYLAGASVYDTLRFTDSLLTERVIIDSTGRAQLSWLRDAYGRLLITCTALPDTVVLPGAIKETTKIIPKIEIREVTPVWVWITLAIVLFLIIAGFFLKIFLKSIKPF